MTTEVNLNRGTWYLAKVSRESDAILGEIIDFQEDPEAPGLHWFACVNRFNITNNSETDDRVRYSSRDFEQFSTLDLFSSEDGNLHLRTLTERSQVIGSQDMTAEPTESAESEESARSYIDNNVFSEEGSLESLPRSSSKKYSRSLGSGDMKTMLKVYEANPALSFGVINDVIDETGHLLLTYTSNAIRQKIINQKIDWLSNRHTMSLSPDNLYKLSYRGKDTIAVYLGDQYWAMHPEQSNSIPDLIGNKFVNIQKNLMINFNVQRLDFSQDREIHSSILETSVSDINPERIQMMKNAGDTDVYVLSEETLDRIPKKNISKNWQKAFVYNYYIGGTIDTKLDLKHFDDSDSIEKLAEARKDRSVLMALA